MTVLCMRMYTLGLLQLDDRYYRLSYSLIEEESDHELREEEDDHELREEIPVPNAG